MEGADTVDDDLWGLLTRLRELVEEATGLGHTSDEGARAMGVATGGGDDDALDDPGSARA